MVAREDEGNRMSNRSKNAMWTIGRKINFGVDINEMSNWERESDRVSFNEQQNLADINNMIIDSLNYYLIVIL